MKKDFLLSNVKYVFIFIATIFTEIELTQL